MGAHALIALVRPTRSCFLLFRILSLLAITCIGRPVLGITEAEALIKFKSSLTHQEAIPNWNPSSSPCSEGRTGQWVGVICENGEVWGLKLEDMGLGGTIDVNALSQLPQLRTVSFKNNMFEGALPEIKLLPKLRSIHLTNNRFSGEIPDNAFDGMVALRRVVLTHNAFTGKIPSSLGKLPFLVELRLDNNRFQGSIPEFQQKHLPNINVANNQLEGPLPAGLKKLNPKMLSGNKDLCGEPLDLCTAEKAAGTKHKSSGNVILIGLGVLALVVLTIVIILVYQNKHKTKLQNWGTFAFQDGNQIVEACVPPKAPTEECTATKKYSGKLDFVRDDRKRFNLSELLTASAEVLESRDFESSYKVELFAGEILVVKRFRQMTKIGREDFQEHIRKMGKLKHPNVLALVAYYYRKEEKLLIFDFVRNGNLASQLHGNHTQEDEALDWPIRLKIIKGVARGLAYLYSELPSLAVPHGYLKSSNVLLNDSYEPLLMDYALKPLINPENAKKLMVAYKSPEYAKRGVLTKKTDVWSLGILILEVLTGKFPPNFLAVGNVKSENLVSWVHEIANEDLKGEDVFDKEMKGTHHSKIEMRKLLKIGFSCCHDDVDVRWSIKTAVEKIEEVNETDNPD